MKREDTPMWSDPEEPSCVRDLLDAGRNSPAEYDVAQGLAAHLAHVQAGTALPHWAKTGASGAASTGSIVAWVVVPVAAVSIAAAVYMANRSDVQPKAAAPRPVAPMVIEAQPASESAKLEAAPQLPSVVPVAAKPAAVPEQSAAKVTTSSKRKVSMSSPTRSVAAPALRTPERSPAAVATSKTVELELPLKVDTRQEFASRREPVAQQEDQTKVAERAPLDDSRLEREMRMLSVAQRVLSEDPDRALRMAQQGEREFPRSMFSAERQQVALLAMVKLGRIDEARRIGTPFLAKYPNAPWSARLRRALATGRVE